MLFSSLPLRVLLVLLLLAASSSPSAQRERERETNDLLLSADTLHDVTLKSNHWMWYPNTDRKLPESHLSNDTCGRPNNVLA